MVPESGNTSSMEANNSPITVSVVNDFELVVRGVEAMLAPYSERVVVLDTSFGGPPDVAVEIALLDATGTQTDLRERIHELIDHDLAKRVLLYAWDARGAWEQAPRHPRVAGVLSKTASPLSVVQAIEFAAAGSDVQIFGPEARQVADRWIEPLSSREMDVGMLLVDGRTNPEIAEALGLSPETVKTYAQRLFDKVGARNRAHAAARIVELGLTRSAVTGGR